ncbi:MAG: histidine kinase [Chitinophagaceae bacterium]
MAIGLLLMIQTNAQLVQRCQYTVYKNSNGLANQVIKSITEDKNGFLWLVSDNQLHWFDGSLFHVIPFGKGIHQVPGVLFHDVYKGTDEKIWIFYDKSFSVYDPKTHSFSHATEQLPVEERKLIFPVVQLKSEIILYNGASLIYINCHSKKISRIIQLKKALLSFYFNLKRDTKWISAADSSGYYSFNLETGEQKRLKFTNKDAIYPFSRINDSLWLAFSYSAVNICNTNTGKIFKTINYPGNKNLNSFSKPQEIIYTGKDTLLMTGENELWEFDLINFRFSKIVIPLSESAFFSAGYFKTVFKDQNGNLWAGSNLNGVYRINLKTQPVRLFATGNENESFIKCVDVNKKHNRVICGTYGNGLLVFDTSGSLIKKIPLKATGNNEPVIINSVKRVNDGYALIFIYGRLDKYELNYKTLELKAVKTVDTKGNPVLFAPGYYSEPLLISDATYYYTSNDTYNEIHYKNQKLILDTVPFEKRRHIILPTLVPVKYINLKEFTGSDYFFNCMKKIGLQDYGTNCISKKGTSWLFGTVKGLYEFNDKGELKGSYTIENGLPDDYIYAMVTDNNGHIWCSHNKGLSKIGANGTITNFNKADGLQDNEFNFLAVAKTPDGQLFFGGVKGLNAFYPDELSNRLEQPRLMITRISTSNNQLPSDTSFWNISNLKLDYTNNRIAIQFSAIGIAVAETYNYQYRIYGLDNEWKNLKHKQEINLALPPGNYQLEIAATALFNPSAKAQQTINISIIPPFYLRWWFIFIGITIVILTASYFFRYINQRKYRSKLQELKMQEELENERQRISRDLHDNIGAYTTALLANVENLRKNNGETTDINKMQNNAEQILNSLRETIWVLNNKEVSVSDFSDGFKTYCFKLLRNFEQIRFNAEEQIVNDEQLKASVSIHLNKIMQEVVQNIIKHSEATEINYSVACDKECIIIISDNGKGFDVEEKRSGNGLDNMYWRAKETGAQLTISSAQNSGTHVEIKLQML